jgi:hypothetical protein
MSNALVAFDTDRIKDYVFATDTLKEIRGASARLDKLNRQLMPRLVKQYDSGSDQIYAHGGAGLFVVEADCADEVRLAVERAYSDSEFVKRLVSIGHIPLSNSLRLGNTAATFNHGSVNYER